MPYIARADIEAIYGTDNLLRLIPDGMSADVVINQAITHACGEADLYVGVQQAVPLLVVPDGLKAAIIDLAFYRIAITHDRLTEEMSERAKTARRLLENIAAGKASLGEGQVSSASEATGPNSVGSPDGAYFGARPRLFGRDA
ncbi:MAG: phage protein Gp36 family protein [Rhabdaerophilum sp.]